MDADTFPLDLKEALVVCVNKGHVASACMPPSDYREEWSEFIPAMNSDNLFRLDSLPSTDFSFDGSASARSRTRSRTPHRQQSDDFHVHDQLQEKDRQITLLTAMLHRSCTKVDFLLKQKKLLQQKMRRVSKRSDQLSDEMLTLKESNKEFSIERVGDKKGTSGKSRSWLTPLGAVNLAVTCLWSQKQNQHECRTFLVPISYVEGCWDSAG